MNATATIEAPKVTRLEARRLREELTYLELGAVMGGSESAAQRWCAGRRLPRRGTKGAEGPAEKMRAWSGGRITIANCHDLVAAPKVKPKPRNRRRA